MRIVWHIVRRITKWDLRSSRVKCCFRTTTSQENVIILNNEHIFHFLLIVHCLFFPSGCSGLIAATISTPADVVKTRIMNNPNVYRGSIDCFLSAVCKLYVDCYMTARDIYSREGRFRERRQMMEHAWEEKLEGWDPQGMGPSRDGMIEGRDTWGMGYSRDGILEEWDTRGMGYLRDGILEELDSRGIGHPGDGTLERLDLEWNLTGTACMKDNKRGMWLTRSGTLEGMTMWGICEQCGKREWLQAQEFFLLGRRGYPSIIARVGDWGLLFLSVKEVKAVS